MRINSIMTTDFTMIPPTATLRSAAERMQSLDTGMLPVGSDGALRGMVTDRELVVRGLAAGMDPDTATVDDCLTAQIVFCHEDDDIQTAADKMEQYQVRRLLVCNDARQPVGIVSLGDLATGCDDHLLTGEVLERVSEPSHRAMHH